MSTGRGRGGVPQWFLLADEELEERESARVVGDLSGSLAGLTILPAADPSIYRILRLDYGRRSSDACGFGAFMPTQRVLSLFGFDFGCPFSAFCPHSWSKGGVPGGLASICWCECDWYEW